MDYNKKDNLTDVATQINNPPTPPPQNQPQSSNTDTAPPQNLGENQVIGNDGTVIDLNMDKQNIVRK